MVDTAAVEVVELVIPPRPEIVSVARLVVGAAVAMDPSFDEERSADLRLAASEACTNAIEAQLARREVRDAHRSIVLRCTLGPESIVLTVQDHGGGFDPRELPSHPAVPHPARPAHAAAPRIPLPPPLPDDRALRETPGGTTVVMTFGPRPASGRIQP